jgi:hypothetical protein
MHCQTERLSPQGSFEGWYQWPFLDGPVAFAAPEAKGHLFIFGTFEE